MQEISLRDLNFGGDNGLVQGIALGRANLEAPSLNSFSKLLNLPQGATISIPPTQLYVALIFTA